MLTAVILAAGRARRMGTLKQLLPWQQGRTMLETVVHTVLACPEVDDEVRVVLGAGREQTRAVLADIQDARLRLLENPHPSRGMLSSIQIGVENLPAASRGFLVYLGDQPLIQSDLVRKLAKSWRSSPTDFLIPVYQRRRGHPVLVHSKYVPEILAMEDADGGLRSLIRRHSERVQTLPVDSAEIHIDLDYPDEYRKYRPGGGGE